MGFNNPAFKDVQASVERELALYYEVIGKRRTTMTRQDAIDLAKESAKKVKKDYNYIPFYSDTQEWAEWTPHEWVVEAILEASKGK